LYQVVQFISFDDFYLFNRNGPLNDHRISFAFSLDIQGVVNPLEFDFKPVFLQSNGIVDAVDMDYGIGFVLRRSQRVFDHDGVRDLQFGMKRKEAVEAMGGGATGCYDEEYQD